MFFYREEKFKISVPLLSFSYGGYSFKGRGSLSRDGSDNFTIEAQINAPLEKGESLSFGGDGVVSGTLIKLKFEDGTTAICPNVFIDSFDIFNIRITSTLTVNTKYVVFFSLNTYTKRIRTGRCVFSIDKATKLPDVLTETKRVHDTSISEVNSSSGLFFRDQNLEIIGHISNKNTLEIKWVFLTNEYTLFHQWRLPKALRTALSICLGQCLEIENSEVYDYKRTIIRYFQHRDPAKLGHFSVIDSEPFNKELFGLLLHNQLENLEHCNLISNLFFRIVDAFKVKNFAIWEFMISTALEATLRTLENKPFQQNKKEDSWRFDTSMRKLKNKYFSKTYIQEYRKIFKEAAQNYRYLRHKNAHPDWTNSKNQKMSQESYLKMRFLVKFYGYLILAFVNYDDLNPTSLVSYTPQPSNASQ